MLESKNDLYRLQCYHSSLKQISASAKNTLFLIVPPAQTFFGLPAKAERTMTNVITHGGLTIAKDLYDLVNDEILANSAISADRFWSGLDKAVHKLAPKNLNLYKTRTKLQKQIDQWLSK